jgi:pyridoxal phosphate enzyme (YggS family)
MPDLSTRLQNVRKRITAAEQRFGREQGSVVLIAVSKTKPAAMIRQAAELGQKCFGESYVQEAVEKIEALSDLALEWHFVGPIQSNKTKHIAARFDWVHSVDRGKIARRLSEQRPAECKPLQLCLQVNISGEQSKQGLALTEVEGLAEEILELPNVRLRGLMAIPQIQTDFDQQRRGFHQLSEKLQALNERFGLQLDTLSMGMSNDLEAAIAEGATFVRVGTDIFGERE